jgi:glycosyltransferase involved in cell wall biosynthesis|tara:strand:- start:153 stop:764 length:612 start_codon:yes stop_codon:yes gene_type:complete
VIFDKLMALLDDRVDYTAFHDCGNGKISDHFLSKKNVNKVTEYGGNDAQSFLNLLEYVNKQEYGDDDIIYFLEDDYLHKEGWIDILLEGFEHIGADYFTLYDHPDKYWLPMYEELQSKVIATPSVHWRTTPSTTNTYACKFKTLKKHFDIHVQYCDLVAKWTKDHDKFTHLWSVGSNLISCIPGYSTHVEGNMLSPTINWEKL